MQGEEFWTPGRGCDRRLDKKSKMMLASRLVLWYCGGVNGHAVVSLNVLKLPTGRTEKPRRIILAGLFVAANLAGISRMLAGARFLPQEARNVFECAV